MNSDPLFWASNSTRLLASAHEQAEAAARRAALAADDYGKCVRQAIDAGFDGAALHRDVIDKLIDIEHLGACESWLSLFAGLDFIITRDKFRKQIISRKSRRKMARKWHS